MNGSTDVPIIQDPRSTDDSVLRRGSALREVKPVVQQASTTAAISDYSLYEDTAPTWSGLLQQISVSPPANTTILSEVSADSAPLQIWEGTVLEVDRRAGVMHVLLNAKMGQMPRHTGEIDLEWVSEQDKDLVCPGAVFYLTLFKRTRHSTSIENAQELRFRRRPSWSAAQLKQIEENAVRLLSKMKAAPTSA